MPSRLPPLSIEGPPLTDPKLWQLKVDGPAERPKTYSMGDIRAFEPANASARPGRTLQRGVQARKWLCIANAIGRSVTVFSFLSWLWYIR